MGAAGGACASLRWACALALGWGRRAPAEQHGPAPELPERLLDSGLTSREFKQQLMGLFRSTRWSSATALEIGAGGGYTTAPLSTVFRLVIALEAFWNRSAQWDQSGSLGDRHSGFGWIDQHRRNALRVSLETGQPHALDIFAFQNISVVVIDGNHDFEHVYRDTFAALHDIPCCVRTIVYHDYCDDVVFKVVRAFVSSGLLAFQGPVGVRRWEQWWCREGRPEGAAFRVLRDESSGGFAGRLDGLSRLATQQQSEASTRARLNGTTWLLLGRAPLGLLTLHFWPASCALELFGARAHGRRVSRREARRYQRYTRILGPARLGRRVEVRQFRMTAATVYLPLRAGRWSSEADALAAPIWAQLSFDTELQILSGLRLFEDERVRVTVASPDALESSMQDAGITETDWSNGLRNPACKVTDSAGQARTLHEYVTEKQNLPAFEFPVTVEMRRPILLGTGSACPWTTFPARFGGIYKGFSTNVIKQFDEWVQY